MASRGLRETSHRYGIEGFKKRPQLRPNYAARRDPLEGLKKKWPSLFVDDGGGGGGGSRSAGGEKILFNFLLF